MKALRKNHFSKFGLQTFSRFNTSTNLKLQSESNKSMSTVDVEDVAHHSKIGDDWWYVHGPLRGLHSMNPLRIKFVRDGLANTGFKETNPSHPLEGIKILDVGCGGGILSEPLARIGAQVTGLDASKELITIAKQHASLDKDLPSNLTYVNTSIEDFSQDKKEEFDAVVASEILEHVIDQELFLKSCIDTLKPKGSIFITTLNKNLISWISGIVAAEHVFGLLPVGTHDWNKFITPEETRRILDKYNCKTKLVHGTMWNPVTNKWLWTSSTLVTYVLHAVKTDIKGKD